MADEQLVIKKVAADGTVTYQEPSIRQCLKHILDTRKKNASISERLSLYPIRDPELFEFWTKQIELTWIASEISFKEDYNVFCTLEPKLRIPLERVLLAFQIIDASVVEGPVLRWLLEGKSIEEEMVASAQLSEETQHIESYALQLKAIIPDPIERAEKIKSIDQCKWIHDFVDFLDKYTIDENYPRAVGFAAQAIMEGVGFQQFFTIIFWYADCPFVRDVPGITASNNLISAAESMHSEIAIFRYKREMEELRARNIDTSEIEKIVLRLFDEIEDITRRSLEHIIPDDIYDLTKENVLNYSIIILEKIKVKMGFPSTRQVVSNLKLKFMERAGGEKKQNFYERDVTTYARGESHVTNTNDDDF